MKDMQTTIPSPVGPLAVTVADDGAVTRIGFGAGEVSDDPRFRPSSPSCASTSPASAPTSTCPASRRRQPLRAARLAALLEIPYGETASYGEIAARIGHPARPAPSAAPTAATRSPSSARAIASSAATAR